MFHIYYQDMPRFKEESVEVGASGSVTPSVNTPTGQVMPLDREEYKDTLRDLRNMSEFAEFVQFLSFFKSLFKISDAIDIEVIEEELLGIAKEPQIIPKVETAVITQLVRAKRIISGPLPDLSVAAWHLYASRGFAPEENPMGVSAEPDDLARLETMEPSTRITILYTFCRWVVIEDAFHDKIDKLVAGKTGDDDEVLTPQSFKVDPVGWRGDFGVYYLLDDNRLYYMEDQAPDLSDVDPKQLPGYVEPKKERSKKRRAQPLTAVARKRRVRAAARRRALADEDGEEEAEAEPEEEETKVGTETPEEHEYISYSEALGRDTPVDKIKWECVCVSLADWETFIESLRNSRESYDKMFYKYLKNDLLPVLREHEEKRVRDTWAREKQREIAKLVLNRKRSSRIEEKQIQQQLRAEEEKRNAEEQRKRIEIRRREREDRERLVIREKRLQARDDRMERQRQGLKPVNQQISAVQEAEESGGRSRRSSRSSSPAAMAGSGRSTRSSSRIIKSQPVALLDGVRRLGASADHWDFDCTCGAYGDNYDDGTLIAECSQCTLWMHVKCLGEEDREHLEAVAAKAKEEGVSATAYEGEYKYVCERCIRKKKEEEERIEYEKQVAAHKQKLKEQQQARKAAAAAAAEVRAAEARAAEAKAAEARAAAAAAAAAAQPAVKFEQHLGPGQQPVWAYGGQPMMAGNGNGVHGINPSAGSNMAPVHNGGMHVPSTHHVVQPAQPGQGIPTMPVSHSMPVAHSMPTMPVIPTQQPVPVTHTATVKPEVMQLPASAQMGVNPGLMPHVSNSHGVLPMVNAAAPLVQPVQHVQSAPMTQPVHVPQFEHYQPPQPASKMSTQAFSHPPVSVPASASAPASVPPPVQPQPQPQQHSQQQPQPIHSDHANIMYQNGQAPHHQPQQ